jgi:hypothetical protein
MMSLAFKQACRLIWPSRVGSGGAQQGGTVLNLNKLLARRELDEWRDEQTLIAARVLNQAASDLILGLSQELKHANWRDGLVGQGAYIRRVVEPKVIEIAEPIATRLVEEANRALADIADHQAIWSRQAGAAARAADGLEGWQDVATGVAPIVGGSAIAATIPAFAVTTTGGLLGTGLFATTVIHWPVIVVGSAAAAVAVATGLVNSARLWDKTEARLGRKVTDHVGAMLIRGTPKNPSILEQLTARYTEVADTARRFW